MGLLFLMNVEDLVCESTSDTTECMQTSLRRSSWFPDFTDLWCACSEIPDCCLRHFQVDAKLQTRVPRFWSPPLAPPVTRLFPQVGSEQKFPCLGGRYMSACHIFRRKLARSRESWRSPKLTKESGKEVAWFDFLLGGAHAGKAFDDRTQQTRWVNKS